MANANGEGGCEGGSITERAREKKFAKGADKSKVRPSSLDPRTQLGMPWPVARIMERHI